jgi:hypothetical protein
VVDQELAPIGLLSPAPGEAALVNCLTMTAPGVPVSMTGVMPRKAFDAVGGFDVQMSTSADMDFVCRTAAQFVVAEVAEPLALYRQHGLQMHRDLKVTERDALAIYSKLFRDGELPTWTRRLEATARTKLYYSLALGYLVRGDIWQTTRCGLHALRRPDLVVLFVIEALWRRLRGDVR